MEPGWGGIVEGRHVVKRVGVRHAEPHDEACAHAQWHRPVPTAAVRLVICMFE